MKKALIFGAGFAGSTIAHLLSGDGWDCTVVESEKFPGGGCRTFFYGGHPYQKGPRVYYGYSEKIFNWVDSFVKLRGLPLYLLSYVEPERQFLSYPIHEDDIPRMKKRDQIYRELAERDQREVPTDFEDYWIKRVGPSLYDMFVDKYSKKMWLIDSNKELDTFTWSAKDKPLQSGSRECYQGSLMAYPIPLDGYNSYFDKTLSGSKLVLGERVGNVDLERKSVRLSDGTVLRGDIIISTIPIEELCNYTLGDLPYAGRKFIVFVLPCKQIFPGDVRFLHYTQDEPYTRIVEYKKLTQYEADDTLLVMELPWKGNKLYPYMIKKYLQRAKSYLHSLPEDVYSIGRLGTYRYSTIEQTIAQSFKAFRQITGKTVNQMDDEFFNIGDVGELKSRKTAGATR